ncbi:hypothetical protein ACFOOM_33705 [Streptomyces echinoruber]|uniref:Uncharacterized protein n=1 Tax=Streptomyces echinoruber TaxID=68898 RepID=A0A918R1X6_9ACTN|nr:hypothetical protein [Streptomyces echinoruber]GGZ80690.1 hypothetical protein GCM10010389_18200 [Streptomyces echinoruber]
MGGSDPHIHVASKTGRDDATVRSVLASTFGLVGDLPSLVTTGCGVQVPYAMTSPHPGKVTCLACREHARREHLRLAEWVERLGSMPGSTVSPVQAKQAAARHRELAEKFAAAEG